MYNVDDLSGVMAEKVSSFAEARKQSTRSKTTEVIDMEPLAAVEPKGKNVMTPMKRKAETSIPMGGKLMADAMWSTRSSRRLAGLRASTVGVSSSGTVEKMSKEPIEVEKYDLSSEVYIPY